MSINIYGREVVSDPSYRHRREMVVLESARELICFANLEKMAEQLRREPTLLCKYLEVRAQSQMIHKKGRYRMKTSASRDEVEGWICDFTEDWVLCGSCRQPETNLEVIQEKKLRDLQIFCKACGFKTSVNPTSKASEKCGKMLFSVGKESRKERKKREKKEKKLKKEKKIPEASSDEEHPLADGSDTE